MALTKDRSTPEQIGDVDQHPVLAGVVIHAGALVVLTAAGWARPGTEAVGLVAVGRAEERVDNTAGADGERTVRVKRGVFRFGNSGAADAITRAEIGDDCFVVDDETVAKTNGTNTRSRAGRIVGVDAQGVWVATGIGH